MVAKMEPMGVVELSDGTSLLTKGCQHIPAGERLILKVPGRWIR